MKGLAEGTLLVPLAESVEGAAIGEDAELGDELSLVPHLLQDAEGSWFAALFTEAQLLAPIAERMGWQTGGGSLEACSLPASVGLEFALQLLSEVNAAGAVFNAGSDHELVLYPDELASIAQGQAIPLVGYVQHIPQEDGAGTLVSELDEPPPAEIVQIVERCVARHDIIQDYALRQTFHAERDREPHFTLELRLSRTPEDASAIGESFSKELEGRLPPPGYIDIVFSIVAS